MNKGNVVCIRSGILFSLKNYATTWLKLEDNMLSEISQSYKDKHCMIPFLYEESMSDS